MGQTITSIFLGLLIFVLGVKVGVSFTSAFNARAIEPPINPKPINP
jgi:hypothetical protein